MFNAVGHRTSLVPFGVDWYFDYIFSFPVFFSWACVVCTCVSMHNLHVCGYMCLGVWAQECGGPRLRLRIILLLPYSLRQQPPNQLLSHLSITFLTAESSLHHRIHAFWNSNQLKQHCQKMQHSNTIQQRQIWCLHSRNKDNKVLSLFSIIEQ